MQDKIRETVEALVGRIVLGAQSGIGSFITFNFSRHDFESSQDDSCLWIRHAAWRLEKDGQVLFANNFENEVRERVKKEFSDLKNLKVLNARVIGICNDLTIEFDEGYFFKAFTYFGNERKGSDSWELFTCDGYLAEVGPGNIKKFIPSNSPVDD